MALPGKFRSAPSTVSNELMKLPLKIACVSIALGLYLVSTEALGQDLEPRRWTPLPPGLNVIGAGYVRSDGDIAFDPVLTIENATVEGDTLILSYVRSFEVGGKRLRFDALLPWADRRWEGLLDGEPAKVTRTGLADPYLRLSIILAGAPAAGAPPSPGPNTVVGAAIGVVLPLGENLEDKLLNLGQNRFIIRPQVGVLHTRGKWSYEFTASTYLFEDNDEFFDGNKREQDPLFATQFHVVRQFDKPGYWAALSAGYAWEGESTINGVEKEDEKRIFLSALTFGMPIGKTQGLKFAYLRNRTNTDTGGDTDSFAIAWSRRF